MTPRWLLIGTLVLMGAAWGLTQPLTKIAVTVGHAPLGLIFWQLTIAACVTTAIMLVQGKGLPLQPRHLGLYAVIVFTGTILPNSASYRAALYLPSGVMSIVLSLIPMMSFPLAIAMATDRFSARRLAGLSLGLAAILLIALPDTSLPDRAMAVWLPLALVAPAFYALEGNYVARFGTQGLDPVQVLCGASILGVLVVLPAVIATDTFIDPRLPWVDAQGAILGIGLAHVLAYMGYVWVVGRAGAVFAAQVAYLVTGFGVLWAALILGESYSGWVWGALALMFCGLFLVQPRARKGLPLVPEASNLPTRHKS